MTRKKFVIALAIVGVLFGFKLIFPQMVDKLADTASYLFKKDIDYMQVFSEIGSSVSLFAEEEASREQTANSVLSYADYGMLSEHSAVSRGEMLAEEAKCEGEEPLIPTAEIPPAVAAFLESQEQYSEVELPENVSYGYEDFPGEMCVPVSGYNSSGFGYRTHPIHGDLRFHYGTDFAAWSGEDIYAFAEGTVTFAGYSDSYGNYITIEHREGWESLYAHCSILYVETGDEVEAGQKIALVGDTGLVTGPHLHFELQREGVYINPEYYVN